MKQIFLFISLCLCSNFTIGEESLLQAEQRIKDGGTLAAEEGLQGHPLYPYLEYRALRNDLNTVEPETVVQFLRTHPNAPFAGWLAEKVFPYWLNQAEYSAIISAYDPHFADESIECEYRLAQLAQGNTKHAFDNIKILWRNIDQEEPACRPLFASAISQGHLSSDDTRERFVDVISSGNNLLAQQLTQYLSPADAPYATAWLKIKKQKQPYNDILTIQSPYWQQNALADILSKYTAKDTEQVLTWVLNHYQADVANTKLVARLFNRLTRALVDKNDPRTIEAWDRIPIAQHDDDTAYDLIAYYLRQGNWQGIADALTHNFSDDEHTAETHYWLAKAYEKLGQTAQSRTQYQLAASKRDFFGFLAAEKLGLDYAFNDSSVVKDDKIIQSLLSTPEAYRMRIFQHLGLTNRAIQEWRSLIKKQDMASIRQASLLASNYGWHIQAISTLAKEKDWDVLNIRFPIAYESKIRNLAQTTNLSPATIYAIIRKESIFQPNIKSPAGALGLMQVMPATARDTAQRHAIPYSGTAQLTDVETNLTIGTNYLADRLREFGHLAYAAAAYNAGPHRAHKWLTDNPNLPLDEWIAQIPFNETRDYVKRVLEYEKVYQYRLGLSYLPYANASIQAW